MGMFLYALFMFHYEALGSRTPVGSLHYLFNDFNFHVL